MKYTITQFIAASGFLNTIVGLWAEVEPGNHDISAQNLDYLAEDLVWFWSFGIMAGLGRLRSTCLRSVFTPWIG